MAQSEPVEVVVEAIDEFSEDLSKLTAELEKIDGKQLDVDLNISDGSDFERIEKLLDKLEEDINTDLHIGMVGEQAVRAAKRNLARDVTTKVKFKTENADKLKDFKATGGDRPNGPPVKIDNLGDIQEKLGHLEDDLSTTLRISTTGYGSAAEKENDLGGISRHTVNFTVGDTADVRGARMSLGRDITTKVNFDTSDTDKERDGPVVPKVKTGTLKDDLDSLQDNLSTTLTIKLSGDEEATEEKSRLESDGTITLDFNVGDTTAVRAARIGLGRDITTKVNFKKSDSDGPIVPSPTDSELGVKLEDLSDIKTDLGSLEDNLSTTLKIDVDGYQAALGKKMNLARDTTATVRLKTVGDGRAGLIGDHVDAKKAANEIINDNVAAAMGKSPSHRDRVPDKFGLDQEFGRGTRDTSPKELDLGIDIPDFDEIQTKLNALGDDIDSTLNIKVSGFRSALGKKQTLAQNKTAVIRLETRGETAADRAIKGIMPDGDAMPRIGFGSSPSPSGSDGFSITNPIPKGAAMPRLNNKQKSLPNIKGLISKGSVFPSLGKGLRSSSRDSDILTDSFKSLAPSATRTAGAMSEFGGSLTKVRPRMSSVYTAALILAPVIVALAGAAVGAAAALAGIATAGAAIVGLGLIGYGDNAAESMKMLQSKIAGVKRDIFKTLKPAMATMNPVVDKWLDGVAPAIEDLVDPLSRLVDYEGFLAGVGGGAVDVIRRFLETVNRLRPKIEDIGYVLAEAFTGFNIVDWGINEIWKNMGRFKQLGGLLVSLVVILYNVAKALAFMVAPFTPLISMMASFSDILNNRVVRGILLVISAIAAANIAVWALTGAFSALAGSVLGTVAASVVAVVGILYNMLAAVWANVGAWYALAGAIAATGVGALLVGGGVLAGQAMLNSADTNAGDMPAANNGGGIGSGTGGATFNVYGDMDDSTYQRVRDDFGGMYDSESQREDAMTK